MIEELERFNQPKKQDLFANVTFAILIAILIAVIILTQIYSVSPIEGSSMENTIHSHDIAISVSPKKLSRGDIVTARAKQNDEQRFIIKRVIGLPGEKLVFRTTRNDGNGYYYYPVELYVDSGDGFVLIDEPYICEVMTEIGFFNESGFTQYKFLTGEYNLFEGDMDELDESCVITLGSDEYFLLGDNRNNSRDSRNYGAFSKGNIMGKVVKILSEGSGLYSFLRFLYSAMGGNLFVND